MYFVTNYAYAIKYKKLRFVGFSSPNNTLFKTKKTLMGLIVLNGAPCGALLELAKQLIELMTKVDVILICNEIEVLFPPIL